MEAVNGSSVKGSEYNHVVSLFKNSETSIQVTFCNTEGNLKASSSTPRSRRSFATPSHGRVTRSKLQKISTSSQPLVKNIRPRTSPLLRGGPRPGALQPPVAVKPAVAVEPALASAVVFGGKQGSAFISTPIRSAATPTPTPTSKTPVVGGEGEGGLFSPSVNCKVEILKETSPAVGCTPPAVANQSPLPVAVQSSPVPAFKPTTPGPVESPHAGAAALPSPTSVPVGSSPPPGATFKSSPVVAAQSYIASPVIAAEQPIDDAIEDDDKVRITDDDDCEDQKDEENRNQENDNQYETVLSAQSQSFSNYATNASTIIEVTHPLAEDSNKSPVSSLTVSNSSPETSVPDGGSKSFTPYYRPPSPVDDGDDNKVDGDEFDQLPKSVRKALVYLSNEKSAVVSSPGENSTATTSTASTTVTLSMLDLDYIKSITSLDEIRAIVSVLANDHGGKYPALEAIARGKEIELRKRENRVRFEDNYDDENNNDGDNDNDSDKRAQFLPQSFFKSPYKIAGTPRNRMHNASFVSDISNYTDALEGDMTVTEEKYVEEEETDPDEFSVYVDSSQSNDDDAPNTSTNVLSELPLDSSRLTSLAQPPQIITAEDVSNPEESKENITPINQMRTPKKNANSTDEFLPSDEILDSLSPKTKSMLQMYGGGLSTKTHNKTTAPPPPPPPPSLPTDAKACDLCYQMQSKLIRTVPRKIADDLKGKLSSMESVKNALESRVEKLRSGEENTRKEFETMVTNLKRQMEEVEALKAKEVEELGSRVERLTEEVQRLESEKTVNQRKAVVHDIGGNKDDNGEKTEGNDKSNNLQETLREELQFKEERLEKTKLLLLEAREHHTTTLEHHHASAREYKIKIAELNKIINAQRGGIEEERTRNRREINDVVSQLRSTCDELDRANLEKYEIESELTRVEGERKRLKMDNDQIKDTIREMTREKVVYAEKLAKAEEDVKSAAAATTALAVTLANMEKAVVGSNDNNEEVESLKGEVKRHQRENEVLLEKLKESNKLLGESRETIREIESAQLRGDEEDRLQGEKRMVEWRRNEAIYQKEIQVLTAQLEALGTRVSVDLYKMALEDAKEQAKKNTASQREAEALRSRVRELENINFRLRGKLPASSEKKTRPKEAVENAMRDTWMDDVAKDKTPTPKKAIGNKESSVKKTPKLALSFSASPNVMVANRERSQEKNSSTKSSFGSSVRSSVRSRAETTKKISPLQMKFLSSKKSQKMRTKAAAAAAGKEN